MDSVEQGADIDPDNSDDWESERSRTRVDLLGAARMGSAHASRTLFTQHLTIANMLRRKADC